ncbi:hypothetical protein PHYSODRAFT_522604 [Phytophthora sojae]|uniref:Uncharacterized protein n=1 Tax=Phytophthora sojae (strain P6497) TaxID=1094619 RepID=G5A4W7_PHYSP|nr:hypothetical protein PHYSODRAFT_522604 [Phytophthora sojae]EGZ09716.1 hypothetical protein PHYSODRAFT_522604 [Phytophthora sojae]|eukprot:XP_009534577.1 hypothetical protein PHYSODRAFT_522604 [Phytophthora sojae]
MTPQDRVCSMLQRERFRNRYIVTKVTIKMLYAINFEGRPIDHFLFSEDPFNFAQGRFVIHDDTQWSGPDPAPLAQIRRADQLHHVLYVIQDAAAEWYTTDVARVFRTVHSDAVNNVPHLAPPQVINAMCNLYQAVFGELFDDILRRSPLCIHYQVAKDCSFPRCSHTHSLHRLPPDVLQWVVQRHGALKSEHPQHA